MTRLLLYNLSLLTIVGMASAVIGHHFIVSNPAQIQRKKELENIQNISKAYSRVFDAETLLKFEELLSSTGGRVPAFGKNTPENFKMEKATGKIRIGCLGDSHTSGFETTNNDYPLHLSRLLGEKYEVINLGVGGASSNEIFEYGKFFLERYDFDILIWGPRGFQMERTASFNPFWKHTTLPNSRFKIDAGKLVRFQIPGSTAEQKSKNYYSLFPPTILWTDDIHPPSLFRTIVRLLDKKIENPFFPLKKALRDIRPVQGQMLKNLRPYAERFIVITEVNQLPELESSDHFEIIKTEGFTEHFPYQAKISHASALGNYLHAVMLKKYLEEGVVQDFERNKLTIEDPALTESKGTIGSYIDIRNVKVLLNGIPSGRLDYLTQVFEDGSTSESDPVKPRFDFPIYLGFYQKDQSLGDGLIIETNGLKALNVLMSSERLLQWEDRNVFFVALDDFTRKLDGRFRSKTLENKFADREFRQAFSPYLKSEESAIFSPTNIGIKIIIHHDLDVIRVLTKNNSLKMKFVVNE